MPRLLHRAPDRAGPGNRIGALKRAGFVAAAICVAAAAQAADRRTRVDPNTPPWNSIAKVQTNIGSHCTGALIAPTVVLTAAHCLWNPRTRALLQASSVHVLFGYEREGYRWHRLAARLQVGPGFDGAKGGGQPSDWARLTLAEPAPVPPLHYDPEALRPFRAVALAGYNQDKAQLLMADRECHVLRAAPGKGGTLLILHDCAGTRGTSGAPLLVERADGWAVGGVEIAAGREANLAIAPALGD